MAIDVQDTSSMTKSCNFLEDSAPSTLLKVNNEFLTCLFFSFSFRKLWHDSAKKHIRESTWGKLFGIIKINGKSWRVKCVPLVSGKHFIINLYRTVLCACFLLMWFFKDLIAWAHAISAIFPFSIIEETHQVKHTVYIKSEMVINSDNNHHIQQRFYI